MYKIITWRPVFHNFFCFDMPVAGGTLIWYNLPVKAGWHNP
ncbi:hypothetical protein CLOBOL_05907 [Enterocloster bolteae ATCC BAA-613]|uniref:Uncharacterized protein n=1 Tax=Enterocloster bolteae (strain ATCC BAA-613 / DSM 15670 / CCUG 46953 / JCM 12243 / WAL 16351) TaxID=411902 RepID=A8S1A8_ENTBW|nr:hypothetical protein CLOBOL_05907 [Enterocloster bolteae ATCC BAA-613]